ncbi:MAG TPA: hypothetical protein VGY66_08310 [Gemmataceae bacterium]|nr:hypothetical protein [Gemmataceae bacterium]
MSARELLLLSPYRVPAQNALMLGDADCACFLNGITALWHPAAVLGASGPPRVASPYDHEQPTRGHIYALPETPPLVLPDEWEQRVREAGAIAFHATSERETTLANLKEAIRASADWADSAVLLDIEPEKAAAFFAIGFGHRTIETLCEAMEHENLLSTNDFWQNLQDAVAALRDPDGEAFRRHLQLAADRLLSAREVLYPVSIYLIDLCILDESRIGERLPSAFDKSIPLNLLAPAALLEKLAQEQPDLLAHMRERLQTELLEVCGGPYVEREDALLPVESQLWNLLKGQAVYKRLLGEEVRVFGRKRFAAHAQLPMLLDSVGIRRAIHLAFDEAVLPTYRATVVSWPSPDGKQVEAFTRMPHPAEAPQTFFHWGHYLHKTIADDHSATLALLHSKGTAGPWYDDLLELSRFGHVLGQWTTLSRYLNEVIAGEYASAPTADEFHGDYLSERINAQLPQPVSWFARLLRGRRRMDTAWTLAALNRGLAGKNDPLRLNEPLSALEDAFEQTGTVPEGDLARIEQEVAQSLANRLQARAAADTPGFLLLNPCSFTRRVALELEGIDGVLPIGGPLKTFQADGDRARLVVEVPALGFAWIPRHGAAGPPPASRMRLADNKTVRNEFFEAEVDLSTGGLRALRDHRTGTNRIGQQLVFNPGSVMRIKEAKATSTGPALGEIISEGALLNEHEEVLALFRQRFRAWLGRPVLEMRIEIYPQHQAQGYGWHAYYGARFAWRDERAVLLRGVNGLGYITSHTRPETPDYLELRSGKLSTVLLPGGLPFHQRHGGRMLDVILVPQHETGIAFEIGLALDRDYPMQTALGMATPMPMIATPKGPPHIGASGWLFYLDAPNLLLSNLRPGANGGDAVLARMLECNNHGGPAEFHCVRDPKRAVLLDAQGNAITDATIDGDAAQFEVAAADLVHLQVEFSDGG